MKNKQDAIVATSVIACAAALLGALVFSISGNPFKNPTLTFTADFANVAGITAHSPVFYAGDKVGVVDKLQQLAPNDRIRPDAIVRLHLSITKKVAIPSHIKVYITSDSMLGAKYIAIERVDDKGGPLKDNARLLSSAPPSLIETMIPNGTEIVADIGSISASLKTFAESLKPEEDAQNLSETIANLKVITDDIKVLFQGAGEDDETLKTKLDAITDNLQTLSADLKELVSGPEDDPEKGLKVRAAALLENLEDFSGELNATLAGSDGEPGLRVKLNEIADEVKMILTGEEGEAGMRERLNETMTKLDTVLLEVQAFIVWGEYVTGTLAEKPNRLIFGNKRNEVPTKEQILNYLRDNEGPYPVIIEGNDPTGDSRLQLPPPDETFEALPQTNQPPTNPPTNQLRGGLFNKRYTPK
ncbi:MAG: MlaD family protein [Verrucomicrobiota bacterium]